MNAVNAIWMNPKRYANLAVEHDRNLSYEAAQEADIGETTDANRANSFFAPPKNLSDIASRTNFPDHA